jgi:glycosyltransferase involved in cell wall biosynthesis
MTRGLAARGHRVTVCTTDVCDTRSRASAPVASPVDVRIFPNLSNRLAYHYQFFTPVGLRRFLRRRVRDFDVAHLHACRHVPGELAARSLSDARVPYVVSPNGTAPIIERRFIAKRVFDLIAGRKMLEGAAMILAVSQAERQQLIELGLPATKLRVVPNPIDDSEFQDPIHPARFRELIARKSEPLVLFLGKLTPRKGVDVLLRAFERIPTGHLVIAGNDMGAGADVDRLVQKLDLQRRVTRVGLIKEKARLDALAAASVVVYPSRAEVFGLVPVEALMCGRPVIVSDDSGCGEIITEVGGGLCVRYGDAIALSAAIGQILAAPEVWTARARDARVLIQQRFGSITVCAALEAAYQKVA